VVEVSWQAASDGRYWIDVLISGNQLHVCRGVEGVPNRVGVVFFHRLAGCRVHWELDSRNWRVEVP